MSKRSNYNLSDLRDWLFELLKALTNEKGISEFNLRKPGKINIAEVVEDVIQMRLIAKYLHFDLEATRREGEGRGLPEQNYGLVARRVVELAEEIQYSGKLHARRYIEKEIPTYLAPHLSEDLQFLGIKAKGVRQRADGLEAVAGLSDAEMDDLYGGGIKRNP